MSGSIYFRAHAIRPLALRPPPPAGFPIFASQGWGPCLSCIFPFTPSNPPNPASLFSRSLLTAPSRPTVVVGGGGGAQEQLFGGV